MDSRRTKSAQARVPQARTYAQPDHPPPGAQQSSFLSANAADYGQYPGNPNQNVLNPATGASGTYAGGRPASASSYRQRERTFSASAADIYAANPHLTPNINDYAHSNAYSSAWNPSITGPPVPPRPPPPNSTAGGQNQSPPFFAFPEPQLYRPTSNQGYYDQAAHQANTQGIYSTTNQTNYQANYQTTNPSGYSGHPGYYNNPSSPGHSGYPNRPLSPASHVSRSSQGSYMSQDSSGSLSPTRAYHGVRQDTITPNTGFAEEYFDRNQYAASVTSFSPERSPSLMAEAVTQLSLDQDTINKFQTGKLSDNDEEWARLVDPEAKAALPPREVKRQAVIFEVIKSEKDYVADLQILRDVFVKPIEEANPPIIPPERRDAFIHEVFWNMEKILAHHQRIVAALFERQREQHPIIDSIADILLDATFAFQEDYEEYIKHYPLAEARHRREMRRNPVYQEFVQHCTSDKRTKKRDLIIFINRPVSRLPRLKLILENVQKYTDENNNDYTTLPFVMENMSEFLKATQPGIAAAESRVKFVSFCENITFRRGEIIDMDLYGETRTMIHMDTVARKITDPTSIHTWTDFTAVLVDHYFIITREEERGESRKYFVVSRPIPLDFLRLGPFIGPPESRRDTEGGGFLGGVLGKNKQMYPFVVYDAASEARKYTLYTDSERNRTKWKQMFEEAISIRSTFIDANKFFVFNVIADDYMRESTVLVSGSEKKNLSGRMISATKFTWAQRAYVAVATPAGIYIAYRSDTSEFSRVLELPKVTVICAIPTYGQLLVLSNKTILSYSLQALVDVAQNRIPPKKLDESMRKLAPKHNGEVTFLRVGKMAESDLLVYYAKGFRNQMIHSLELRETGIKEIGKGAYLPGVPTDVQFMNKVIAIISDKGMTILDPYNIQTVVTVPDFSEMNNDPDMTTLKEKCDGSRTLGMVSCSPTERLCIYEEYGCYITKYGAPTRKSGFVRWEIKANTFVSRPPHILLFGDNFVEIRDAETGQFRQMVEHKSIRVLEQTGLEFNKGDFLIGWKGEKNDASGQSDALVEVLETRELSPVNSAAASIQRIQSFTGSTVAAHDPLWDEWN